MLSVIVPVSANKCVMNTGRVCLLCVVTVSARDWI